MHVAGREAIRSARVAIGHRDDDRLLQAQDVAQLRMRSPSASMIASSVVPGFPKSVSTPSSTSRRRNAERPEIVVIVRNLSDHTTVQAKPAERSDKAVVGTDEASATGAQGSRHWLPSSTPSKGSTFTERIVLLSRQRTLTLKPSGFERGT